MWAHVQDNKMTSFQIHHQGHLHPLHACIKRRDNLRNISGCRMNCWGSWIMPVIS